MYTTKEWLEKYEQVKNLLVSPVNFDELFKMKKIDANNLFILNMGEVNFYDSKVLVRDPLVWLTREEQPYIIEVPIGKYQLETLVAEIEENYYRYIATRIKFNNNTPKVYHQALKGDENLEDIDRDSIFGFNVDAGLATIVDIKTRDAYCDFVDNWCEENPGKDIYDNFFDDEFKKSYLKYPKFQTEVGDWINFKIPNTEYTIPMIQSGYGDGQYPVYFGYDENGNICDVIIEYIFVGGMLNSDIDVSK
ncbi:DUF4241 domain-containing protein [Gemelliphila palaticanis]|uniref:DUF4241 domain-containing protein n=1 Tax=Gemelliphila palaticanis TaxID=81950 RepID=A0ABX2SZ91_9BACL|nr:DUF4241 domain-containing protein [Gemella palaticanis]MBF0715665.1 DUF4241 domain-containing protein [Gemella palaticanis]NYS47595.1 DUF4241 domain-containing protein [Gemella palaticanis]